MTSPHISASYTEIDRLNVDCARTWLAGEAAKVEHQCGTQVRQPPRIEPLQQQISDDIGVFGVGWANGHVEPWDFTDVDGTFSSGTSLSGRLWARPGDTVGIAGVVNSISVCIKRFSNAGDLGILVGDGMLPHPGLQH